MSRHGYSAYSHGCRCEVCRAAKADYVRERRAQSRPASMKHTKRGVNGTTRGPGATRYVAPIARHGTRFAYDEHCCRCFPCSDARAASDRKRRPPKSAAA